MKINIINTTTDSLKTAKYIAEYLVKKELSPCVQIITEVVSKYKWQGKVIESNEYLLIIKTIPFNVLKCKQNILKYHNYQNPEILVSESKILSTKYKQWFLNKS